MEPDRAPRTLNPRTAPILIGAAIGVAVGWIILVVLLIVVAGRAHADRQAHETAPAAPPDATPAQSSREASVESQTGPDSASGTIPPRPYVPALPSAASSPAKEIDRSALRTSLAEVEQRSGGRLALSYIGPDQKTGFAYNGDQSKPAEELITLCLMVSALIRVDRGEWSLDAPFGGTGMTLAEGLREMMAGSDPAVANAIIDQVGIEELNGEIRGYMALSPKTVIQRKVLDMAARAHGLENTTTTNDIAQLLFSLARGDLLGSETTAFALEAMRGQRLRSMIPRGIPSLAGVEIGNRPAELPDLESDAAIIWYPDGRWSVLVVSIDGHQDPLVARQAVTDATAIVWTATH